MISPYLAKKVFSMARKMNPLIKHICFLLVSMTKYFLAAMDEIPGVTCFETRISPYFDFPLLSTVSRAIWHNISSMSSAFTVGCNLQKNSYPDNWFLLESCRQRGSEFTSFRRACTQAFMQTHRRLYTYFDVSFNDRYSAPKSNT